MKNLIQKVSHLPEETKVYISYDSSFQSRSDVDGIRISSNNEIFVDHSNKTESFVTLKDLIANDSLVVNVDDGDVYRHVDDLVEKDYGILILTNSPY